MIKKRKYSFTKFFITNNLYLFLLILTSTITFKKIILKKIIKTFSKKPKKKIKKSLKIKKKHKKHLMKHN